MLKMKILNQKYLLKRAGGGLVPESILRRSKQSYRAPDGKDFFDETAPDYVSEPLSPCPIDKSWNLRPGIYDN
jgi:asparagine synthase (glutamine-hydrolysing)